MRCKQRIYTFDSVVSPVSAVAKARVLFVSKPLAFPVADGSLCLVRDLASQLERYSPAVITRRGLPGAGELSGLLGRATSDIEALRLRAVGGSFAPALRTNAETLVRLLTYRRAAIWHFVFAPNPKTNQVLRRLRTVRRVPMVQTVASAPRSFSNVSKLLFGDLVVTQSEWTRTQLQRNAPKQRIEVVLPSVGEVSRPKRASVDAIRRELRVPENSELLVYPGDYEFSSGAEHVARLIESGPASRVVVYACRQKTEGAREVEKALRSRLAPERVRFAGQLPSLLPLLAASNAVLFPVDSLFGKVDLPISLLEAMALGVPVVTYQFGPLRELEGAVQVAVGDVGALAAAVRAATGDSEYRAQVIAQQLRFTSSRTPKAVATRYEELYDELAY